MKKIFQTFLDNLPPDPLPWSVMGFTAIIALIQMNMAPLADIAIISSVILACLYYFRNKFSFSHIVLFIISGCIIGCINIAYHNHFRISTKTLEKPLYNQEAIEKILRIKDRGKKKYYYIENIIVLQ